MTDVGIHVFAPTRQAMAEMFAARTVTTGRYPPSP